MALNKCPECQKKISNQCIYCPQCGYLLIAFERSSDAQSAVDTENSVSMKKQPVRSSNLKFLMKKWWFWIAIGVVIIAVVTIMVLLNRETEPRRDENGNPIFIELTDEVYTNADNYLGYYVEVKGKVFQNIGDNGDVRGVQVWIDPDNCEQNLIIYYTTNEKLQDGDYVVCTGYISGIHTYINAFGTEISAPLIYSHDLKNSTYTEVVAPAIESLIPINSTVEQAGYSLSISQVEFAEKETRIYVTVSNHGSATLNIGDAVIIQKEKQYNSISNFEADYEELPYEIVKNATCSGVLVFPAVDNATGFELRVNLFSDNYDEELSDFVIIVG